MNRKPSTLGQLRDSGYRPRSVKRELRDNVRQALSTGAPLFPGILGYERTVIPGITNALLAEHDFILLGLRGQAKTRILRALADLLDDEIPVLKGSELNDDPLAPISTSGQRSVAEHGDETPIEWLSRGARYNEKLATPDVSIADLIGDIDPIKAATRRLTYADPEVIHFGVIARTNRGIFAINELPDLAPRIQVGLLNILEERDLQIRGFPVRIPLDVMMVFSANPEDYTNRGSIVTPLKDRIGSQILTHYPKSLEIAKRITAQEARLQHDRVCEIHVPEISKDLVEQIGFEARENEYVDSKSGISARMGITSFENLLSTAEHRAIGLGLQNTSIRFSDILGMIPSITGKVELVYEGEQEGASFVAERLIGSAAQSLFDQYFPAIKKLKHEQDKDPYDGVLQWFFEQSSFELMDNGSEEEYNQALRSIEPLTELVQDHMPDLPKGDLPFVQELVLWSLAEYKKLNRKRIDTGIEFKDNYGAYLSNL